MHNLNFRINGCHSYKIWGFCQKQKFPSILVARQRTSSVLYLLSITLLQNITDTLFETNCEIKGQLLYCIRFEMILKMILNSWLLSQICRQRERTSLRDGLPLPSNSTEKILRHHHLYSTTKETHQILLRAISVK